MEENDGMPVLVSCKPLNPEFGNLQNIKITSGNFTLGRGQHNSAVIPYISISRNHCIFKRNNDNDWEIQDNSTFGILINGITLGKGRSQKLSHQDEIILESSREFIYKFINISSDNFKIPCKKIKLEDNREIINDVKEEFEASQHFEIQHIEEKIQNAKQMQVTINVLKEQMEKDKSRQLKHLENIFAVQIESLKGEKNDVEKQKVALIEERDAQLASIKNIMEEKIAALMAQIMKHKNNESDLLKENHSLKEKLLKEREEFLSELNRESSSKEDMLRKLKAKVKEQEEARVKEREALVEMLRKETEQLRLAKEKELKELQEQKKQKELELEEELKDIKKNLQIQVEQSEQEKLKAEQLLNEQMEKMKKVSDEDKIKVEQLMREREEIQRQLTEAHVNAEKYKEELNDQIKHRETELAAIAAERIQKQVDESSEVIHNLQDQLEKVRNQLSAVESEKNCMIENFCVSNPLGEGSSNQAALNSVGEILESELQCSICAELFIEATTLNCSHTFCKHCINTWKKKKKDCPICRASITLECRSLVLDSFIERMVEKLSDEIKLKRQSILQNRAAEVAVQSPPTRMKSLPRRIRRRTARAPTPRRRTETYPAEVVDLTSPLSSSNSLLRAQPPAYVSINPIPFYTLQVENEIEIIESHGVSGMPGVHPGHTWETSGTDAIASEEESRRQPPSDHQYHANN